MFMVFRHFHCCYYLLSMPVYRYSYLLFQSQLFSVVEQPENDIMVTAMEPSSSIMELSSSALWKLVVVSYQKLLKLFRFLDIASVSYRPEPNLPA